MKSGFLFYYLATDTIIKLINQDEILQEKFVKFDFIKGETVKKL